MLDRNRVRSAGEGFRTSARRLNRSTAAAQLPGKIVADPGDQGGKEIPVVMDDHEVIHVAPVGAYRQGVFNEVVQWIEVEVGEDLPCKISNGKPTPVPGGKEALVGR